MKARLTRDEIDRITLIVASWEGDITWRGVCDAVESQIGRKFTRQGLFKNERIKLAYVQAKERSRDPRRADTKNVKGKFGNEWDVLKERLVLLKNENIALRQERDALCEKFAVWLYNARSRGITSTDLNKPLPSVDRGYTD